MRKLPLLICLLLATATSIAQPVRVLVYAGSGLSFVSTKNTWGNYKPISNWHAGVSAVVPLPASFRFEIGLGYERRGFKNDSTREQTYRVTMREENTGYEHYHYLVIPLQLSARIWHAGKHSLYAGGGMNYGIMQTASRNQASETYINGDKMYSYAYDSKPPIGLVQKGERNGNIAKDYISLYRFDVGLKTQLSYYWKERYMARLSYNYSLYDVHASTMAQVPPQKFRQHAIGFTIGFVL